MWQPDGWSARARIGILMPPFDIGPEVEFQAMATDGVSIHSTRVPLGVTMPGGAKDPGIAMLWLLGIVLGRGPIQTKVYTNLINRNCYDRRRRPWVDSRARWR